MLTKNETVQICCYFKLTITPECCLMEDYPIPVISDIFATLDRYHFKTPEPQDAYNEDLVSDV